MAKKKLDPNFSNEKILEVIRDYSSDTIYFKDAHSRFVWNNRAHAAQFGVSDPREMAGKTDADFFPKDFATRARREEMEIMETRIPLISNTERLEKPDGSVVWYSASKYPIIDENEELLDIIAKRLVKDEILTGEQLEEICNKYKKRKSAKKSTGRIKTAKSSKETKAVKTSVTKTNKE